MKQKELLKQITKLLVDENQVIFHEEKGKEVFYRIYDEYYYEYVPQYERGGLRCQNGYKSFNRMKKLAIPSDDEVLKIELKKYGNSIEISPDEFRTF